LYFSLSTKVQSTDQFYVNKSQFFDFSKTKLIINLPHSGLDLSDNYILILSCEGSQWDTLRRSLFGPDMFPVNLFDAHFKFEVDYGDYRELPPSDDVDDVVDDAAIYDRAIYDGMDDYFQEEENRHLGNQYTRVSLSGQTKNLSKKAQ
jgi:hypothetical protein